MGLKGAQTLKYYLYFDIDIITRFFQRRFWKTGSAVVSFVIERNDLDV